MFGLKVAKLKADQRKKEIDFENKCRFMPLKSTEDSSIENVSLFNFIDFIQHTIVGQPNTEETKLKIESIIRNFCNKLMNEGKISKEFSEELNLFFKLYVVIEL